MEERADSARKAPTLAISDDPMRLPTPREELTDKIKDSTEDHADHHEMRGPNPASDFRKTERAEGGVQQPKLRGEGKKGDAKNRAEDDGAK